jgi:hypothetical protein
MGNIHYAAGRHAEALRCWRAGVEALTPAGDCAAASSPSAGGLQAAANAGLLRDGSPAAAAPAHAGETAALEGSRAAVLGNIGIVLARLGRYQVRILLWICNK